MKSRLDSAEAVMKARLSGKLVNRRVKYKLIDAFCGAGGMTLGFSEAFGHGFRSVWANDYNDDCVETYKKNFGKHCVGGDIVAFLEKHPRAIPKADVVIGGVPCQGFSLLNKNRKGDPRKEMWRPFLEIVRRSKARIFVIENVPQILNTYEHGEISKLAKDMGFKMHHAKLCAADYGVSQTRWRAFIIGCKGADPAGVFPPKKTHAKSPSHISEKEADGYVKNPEPWQTVKSAIADLPPPDGTEIRDEEPPLDLQFGRSPTPLSLKRYKSIPKEGMNRFDLQRIAPELTPDCWIKKKSGGTDLFGRLWWDKPAFTIRTEFYKPEKGRYLHPVQNRPITHREAARLQSFPDSFVFTGTKIEVAKQIGNAVPPLLASRVADCVYALLEKSK